MKMNSKLAKIATGAGLGYAGYKLLDNKYALGNDVEVLQRILKYSSKITKYPDHMTVTDMWEETVARNPNKVAMICADTGAKLTFNDLDAMCNKVATWAREVAKLQEGSVVALFMENRIEYVWVMLGLSKAGITVALINNNNKAKPLVHSIKIANCSAVIYGSELGQVIEDVKDEISHLSLFSLDDPDKGQDNYLVDGSTRLENALHEISSTQTAPKNYRTKAHKRSEFGYIYTSGTTGLPKACVITHYKFMSMSIGGPLFGLTDADRMFTALPLYHSSGLGLGFGNCVNLGCTVIITRKFSASNFFKQCTEFHATAVQYIGELCRYLLNVPTSPFDQKHQVRIAIGNGLRREIWVEFQKRFNIPEIGEFYGSTEGTVAMGNFSRGVLDGDLSSVGAIGRYGPLLKKIAGFKVVKHDVANEAIVRDPETGKAIECEPNESGELLGLINNDDPRAEFKGYVSKEATEKKVVRNVLVDGDMYFRTGDLVKFDEKYYYHFVDRIGDTFRWKGENVSTGEVSEITSVFPGVLESNIYGAKVPGAMDGRACMAAMVLENPTTFDYDGFSKHVHKQLASYAVPLFIRVLPEMEITGTFKHRKVEFVKEGIDMTLCKDPIKYLDVKDKTYKDLTPEAWNKIATGQAKL